MFVGYYAAYLTENELLSGDACSQKVSFVTSAGLVPIVILYLWIFITKSRVAIRFLHGTKEWCLPPRCYVTRVAEAGSDGFNKQTKSSENGSCFVRITL